jgi:hypothetical protein
MITTRVQLTRRLRELLTGLRVEEREQVITEVADRYQFPAAKRSPWRIGEGLASTESPQLSCTTVQRTDGSAEEVYASYLPGHANRARMIADALNQIEEENIPLPGEPPGASA